MPTICVDTYERQHDKYDKQLGQKVAAFKMGPIEALVALAGLGPQRARRVVPRREGGYTYVQLLKDYERDIRRENHYLVFEIDEAQQAAVERITRQIDLPCRAFRLQDGQWLHFPTKTQSDYQPPDESRRRYLRLPATPGSSLAIQTTAELSGSGLTIARTEKAGGDPWWWIGGDTYPHKDLLRRKGCRWSRKRKQWYFIGHDLPAEIAAMVESVPEDEPDEPEPVAKVTEAPVETLGLSPAGNVEHPKPEPEEHSGPRIVPPPVIPTSADNAADDIQQALVAVQSRQYPKIKQQTIPANKLQAIGQSPIGELSGNISGSVYCYGYAQHDGLLVYLNLGGPTTAVEAIIARVQAGKPVNLNRWEGPAIELMTNPTPDSPQNPDRVRLEVFSQYLPEARFRSSILVDRRLAHPEAGGAGVTFIIRTDEAQAQALLLHHVREACSLPVFDDWAAFLWDAGQTAGLVRPTRSKGGIDLLTVLLDDDAWSRLIAGGIAQETIQLPEETHHD